MLLGTLAATILRDSLAGKKLIRAGVGELRASQKF